MLTREQFQTVLGKYATADDEDTLKDISAMMTTYDEMSNPALQQERDDYKAKYENVVKEYKYRFLTPNAPAADITPEQPEDDEAPEKFDDLFS